MFHCFSVNQKEFHWTKALSLQAVHQDSSLSVCELYEQKSPFFVAPQVLFSLNFYPTGLQYMQSKKTSEKCSTALRSVLPILRWLSAHTRTSSALVPFENQETLTWSFLKQMLHTE